VVKPILVAGMALPVDQWFAAYVAYALDRATEPGAQLHRMLVAYGASLLQDAGRAERIVDAIERYPDERQVAKVRYEEFDASARRQQARERR
jgi:hypothetical protein